MRNADATRREGRNAPVAQVEPKAGRRNTVTKVRYMVGKASLDAVTREGCITLDISRSPDTVRLEM